jgi:hypothetical protein
MRFNAGLDEELTAQDFYRAQSRNSDQAAWNAAWEPGAEVPRHQYGHNNLERMGEEAEVFLDGLSDAPSSGYSGYRSTKG